MSDIYDVRFDAAGLFEHLGGVPEVERMLTNAGIPVRRKTLQKQRERDHMPSGTLASILYAAAKTGKQVNLYQFLLVRDAKLQIK